jgi:hypothetical protein
VIWKLLVTESEQVFTPSCHFCRRLRVASIIHFFCVTSETLNVTSLFLITYSVSKKQLNDVFPFAALAFRIHLFQHLRQECKFGEESRHTVRVPMNSRLGFSWQDVLTDLFRLSSPISGWGFVIGVELAGIAECGIRYSESLSCRSKMFGKNRPFGVAAVRQKTSGRLWNAGKFTTHVLFFRGPADQPAGVARLLPFGPSRNFTTRQPHTKPCAQERSRDSTNRARSTGPGIRVANLFLYNRSG